MIFLLFVAKIYPLCGKSVAASAHQDGAQTPKELRMEKAPLKRDSIAGEFRKALHRRLILLI